MKLPEIYIQELKKYFSSMPVLKAYLFGSYARQDADENSDIDILVELDYQKGIGFTYIEMQNYLSTAFSKKIDLVSANGISPFIVEKIENEKQLIYER